MRNGLEQYQLVWHTVSLLHHFAMGNYNYISLYHHQSLLHHRTHIWVINQACSIKMAEHWPSLCLHVACLVPLIDYMKKRASFSCGPQGVIPSRQDSVILPARVANHSAGFSSSCPLTELGLKTTFIRFLNCLNHLLVEYSFTL